MISQIAELWNSVKCMEGKKLMRKTKRKEKRFLQREKVF